ncbi:FtsW/RodA/SpoVE family cell cycle protein [Paenibacillus tengchongensis]|uniref:FtsW/RodA/SpoVE family cell cycle protein n=1 Tax=Paenibacillus tengchongensis TaxID=2608684 RepID=UPI00124F5E4F|nr:FtsW/RodA/SpoVE family cell cycle protein [Paenibacillus tengchongensis]
MCIHIRAREMHGEIRSELAGHLEDRVSEWEQDGKTRQEAETMAVSQMGDPVALGKELNKAHRPRMPWKLLGAVLGLAAISLLGMGSLQAGGMPVGVALMPLQRQAVFILIGMALMLAGYFADYRKLLKGSWWIYGAALFMIAFVGRYGLMINGQRSYWILVPLGFSFDAVSLSLYMLVLALAGILIMEKSAGRLGKRRNILREAAVLLIPLPFYVLAGGLPELALYLVSALALYTWFTGRWLRSCIAVTVLALGSLPYLWKQVHFRDRLLGAVDYNINPDSSGYMYRMLHETMQSAGWWGHGFGAVADKIPFSYSDMLPAYMIHTFGWAGGLVLAGAVFAFFAVLRLCYRTVRDPYGKALMLSLSLLLAVQMVYGLSVLSGKMFIASLSFPFLSYGGHVLLEFAVLGLIMGIYRRKDITPAMQLAPAAKG